MANPEAILQAKMVIEFSQRHPEKRGGLIGYFATSDSYIQAAQKLSLGLVKGCSDLLYINKGELTGIEVKATGTSHDRIHIIEQCRWLLKVPKLGYFCDSIEMFWEIINGGNGIDPIQVMLNCEKLKTVKIKWEEAKK